MADPIRQSEPTEEPRIVRVAVERQREAVALLLTGQASASSPTVQPFLNYARQQGLALNELWAVQRGGRLEAAALIVPCAGRSAMLFCSPASSWPEADLVVQLFRTACRAQSPERIRLIQALVDPPQEATVHALREAGFWDLATLKYLQRRVDRRPSPRSANPLSQYQTYHWSEAHRARFADAILASYEQTLDCPGLRGIREVDDIIAGHQAAGTFRPELWHAIYDGDQPVAVMLINELPQVEACELVYLGLALPYRGQGLGRRLLEYGIDLAHAQGQANMILAVDDRNEPAMRLYRAAGFRETAARRALVWVVGG